MALQDGRGYGEGQRAEEESLKGAEATRYQYLSRPKIYHYRQTKWVNGKGAIAKWGTQEMLTPPTDAAKRATASARIETLAKAKTDKQENISRSQYYYSCGRDSQISLVADRAKTAACTPRLEQLATPKEPVQQFRDRPHKDQYTYSCGRESPIWPVGSAAQSAEERPKTNTLARHKEYHSDYQPERPLPNLLAPGAKSARCSDRVDELAKAKERSDKLFREALWEVSRNARKATASPRTLELARSKPLYEGYHFNFDYGAGSEKLPKLIRVVTRNAKNALASSRTKELAVPIIRQTMDSVQFNPHAFIISRTALNAYCPPRIGELAQPIVR